MNIGFIGLGNMGSGMASNLLDYCKIEDHTLIVYDLNSDAMQKLATKGAELAKDHSEVSSRVDVLFTSLPSSKEICQLAYGDDGILSLLTPGSVWFETSTNDLAEWQKIIRSSSAEITLVDAPVTGGAEGAEAGNLTMLMGVESELLERFEPLLASFTNKAIRMGPAGAGYVSKLCQLHLNYLVAQGIGEALMMGSKANLNLGVLYEVLQNSCAQSYVVDNYIPKVLDGSYDPSFTLGLARKDMRLISELGEYLKVPMPLGDIVLESYHEAVTAYGESEPHLKIVKLLEDQAQQYLRSANTDQGDE